MRCKKGVFTLAVLRALAALTGAYAQPASFGRALQLDNTPITSVGFDYPDYYR
jgi:hypothetical protein